MTDPLKDLHDYRPADIDLSGMTERALTDTERSDLVHAALDARSNKEFIAAALGNVLKLTGKLIHAAICLVILAGCAAQMREVGRQAATGALDVVQGQINARIADVSARVDAEAARANAALEAKAPAIVLQARDALAPQIDAAVTKGGDALQASLDAKILAAQAKRTGGEPMTPLDWFWLALGASGAGAGGVSIAKSALRKILGLTAPVDQDALAEAVAAKLTPRGPAPPA